MTENVCFAVYVFVHCHSTVIIIMFSMKLNRNNFFDLINVYCMLILVRLFLKVVHIWCMGSVYQNVTVLFSTFHTVIR